jgi:hypothetical protein
VQKTVTFDRPGFTVKTRQQPFEECVATKASVTPDGSALGGDSGSDSLSDADEAQATNETDITKQNNANRRIPSMPRILGLPPADHGILSPPRCGSRATIERWAEREWWETPRWRKRSS